MILLYPLLLVVPVAAAMRAGGRDGWWWFGAWSVAGGLLTFSWLAGLSIGLLVLPFAAVALVAVAAVSGGREVLGFVAGIGSIFLVVAYIQIGEGHARSWLLGGVALTGSALLAYAVARSSLLRRRPRRGRA